MKSPCITALATAARCASSPAANRAQIQSLILTSVNGRHRGAARETAQALQAQIRSDDRMAHFKAQF